MWRLAAKNTQFKSVASWGLGLVLAANTALVCAQDSGAAERYAKLLADVDSLTAYNAQLSQQLKSQDTEVTLLQKQVADLDGTSAQVVPLIQKMFTSLDEFVKNDLPFLDPTQAGPDTRKERMDRLRDLMAQQITPDAEVSAPQATEAKEGEAVATAAQEPAATAATTEEQAAEAAALAQKEHVLNAERYRRLLEAYQIELDYGRTMAAYKGKLADGREADFVRVGRVTLLYRTTDGEESGYWDAQQKQWVMDNDYNKAVENAVLIATKESAPDLVTVPVPAPQEMPL